MFKKLWASLLSFTQLMEHIWKRRLVTIGWKSSFEAWGRRFWQSWYYVEWYANRWPSTIKGLTTNLQNHQRLVQFFGFCKPIHTISTTCILTLRCSIAVIHVLLPRIIICVEFHDSLLTPIAVKLMFDDELFYKILIGTRLLNVYSC